MKKIIIISLLFCLILISCQKETSVQIIEPITEQKEWTILIYMVGDSNLEKFAIKDINEIEKVIKSDEIEVYVFLDRDEKHDKTNDDWTGAKLYKLNWDKNPSIINSKIIKYYSEVDSSDSSIILDTINISFKNPSKKNGLIFWGHGNGWKGYGFDNSHNKSSTSMNNFTDLSNSIKKLNIPKFDFVFFFSCLMGQLEVQSNFIGISKYFVGSEDLMYISNSFYSLVFQELSNNPSVSAIEIIKIIADKYYERIPLRTIQKEITISIIDLDKLNESLTSFNNLMSVLYKNEFHYNVLKSRLYTHEFFLSRENSNYIDLIDFLNILSFDNAFKNIKEDILNVKKSFFESILFSKSGSSQNRANGISIFMPKNIDNFDQNYTKIPFVQDNIGWKNLLDELKIYLEKDKIPPVIILNEDTNIQDSSFSLNGKIIDENPVEIKIISAIDEGNNNIKINKIEQIPIKISDTDNEHSFNFNVGKNSLILNNGAESIRISYLDIFEKNYFIISAIYQFKETKETIPVQIYFDKTSGEFISMIGSNNIDQSPYYFEPKINDKLIFSDYYLDVNEKKIEKKYDKTITIKDLNPNIKKIYDKNLNSFYVFSKDMANNKKIKKIN